MRRSRSIRLTLLPWLASAALAQAQTACAAPRTPANAATFRDPDDCFDDRRDDDCYGPAPAIANSPVNDARDRHDTTDREDPCDRDDSCVREGSPGSVYRGGFGSYFWMGGG